MKLLEDHIVEQVNAQHARLEQDVQAGFSRDDVREAMLEQVAEREADLLESLTTLLALYRVVRLSNERNDSHGNTLLNTLLNGLEITREEQ